MIAPPPPQGLYDPANEHDSCGVGFVANIKGEKSNAIIRDGLLMLANLDHRGARGADPLVGDGSGCLIQIPDELFRDWALENAISLPKAGDYAVAMCFLPQNQESRDAATARLERFIGIEGQVLLGWRDVPVDTAGLGTAVLESMPVIRQAIVARGPRVTDQDAFERKILTIRKQTQNPLFELAEKRELPGLAEFYIASFSTRTLVYKGLCSQRRSALFIATWSTRGPSRRLRLSISASRPTPSRAGSLRIPIASLPITARSIRFAAM